ncbi:MAG: hypothetical protein JWO44_900 [Bacteroidetes bacterium]|nr:hypothetical protein [Bacteroidota bacterium]
MKKTISFVCFILLASISFAQTKTASKLGTSSKLSHNDSVMCSKTWKVTSVEEWQVVTKPPAEKNQNDMLQMTLDGKFNLILFGAKKAGTWSRSGQNIYFLDDTGVKFSYKVVSVDPKKIKVDHYSDEEGHSIFEME